MSSLTRPAPPDQRQREQALDAGRSILVQAPAGSGKTDLLTRRFLRLLSEVDEPGRIVAITFTKAAAAEMRNRILSELEKAAASDARTLADDEFSMEFLARRALQHSRALGWDLLKMPAQLRISTIDSFCYELALQQPLLSGLGGGLDITERPAELYHRAARRTLDQIGEGDLSAGVCLAWFSRRGAALVARQRTAGNGRPAGEDARGARPLDAGILAARFRRDARGRLGRTARKPGAALCARRCRGRERTRPAYRRGNAR